MKKWNSIIIFSGALIILTLLLVLVPRLGGEGETKTDDPTAPVSHNPVVSVDESDVESITVENDNGKLIFSKRQITSEGQDMHEWILSYPEDISYNKAAVTARIAGYININASSEVGTGFDDLSEFGFDNPDSVVTLELDSGETKRVLFGDVTVAGNSRYVMLEGSDRVCTVLVSRSAGAFISYLDLLDRNILASLIPADTDSIEFFRKRDNLEFTVFSNKDASPGENLPDTWKFVSPVEVDTSLDGFYTFLENIYSISPVEFLSLNPENLADYGLDDPGYEIVLISGEMQVRILLGGNAPAGYFYGYSSYTDSVFKVSAAGLGNIDKPVRELLTPFVFLPAIWDVNTVDINIGDLNIFCEIKDDKDKEEPSDFRVNGRDANVVNSRNSSYFRGFYQSLISIHIAGIDPWAVPETIPQVSIEYKMKNPEDNVFIEFAVRDDTTYYVFKDGKYQGYYVNKSSFYSQQEGREGIAAAFEILKNAMDNQVDGVYNGD